MWKERNHVVAGKYGCSEGPHCGRDPSLAGWGDGSPPCLMNVNIPREHLNNSHPHRFKKYKHCTVSPNVLVCHPSDTRTHDHSSLLFAIHGPEQFHRVGVPNGWT